jgi:hypothetical protein
MCTGTRFIVPCRPACMSLDSVTDNQPVRTTTTDIRMPVISEHQQDRRLKPRNQVYVGT